jgi:hypothetical protein
MNTAGIPKRLLFSLLCSLSAGCASVATTENTRALGGVATPGIETGAYAVVTVMPFVLGTNTAKADRRMGENFAGDIVGRLKTDYPGLFHDVRWNKTNRVASEVIVEGTIRTYTPGSAGARLLLIGLGPSSFDGEVRFKDAQDGRVLLTASFDKLWAWGGYLGGSKTIDNMVGETAVAIVKTIALWKQGKLPKRTSQ